MAIKQPFNKYLTCSSLSAILATVFYNREVEMFGLLLVFCLISFVAYTAFEIAEEQKSLRGWVFYFGVGMLCTVAFATSGERATEIMLEQRFISVELSPYQSLVLPDASSSMSMESNNLSQIIIRTQLEAYVKQFVNPRK